MDNMEQARRRNKQNSNTNTNTNLNLKQLPPISQYKDYIDLLMNGQFNDVIKLLQPLIPPQDQPGYPGGNKKKKGNGIGVSEELNEYRLLMATALYYRDDIKNGENDTQNALHYCNLITNDCEETDTKFYEARKIRGLIHKKLRNYKAACHDFEFICYQNPYHKTWRDKLYSMAGKNNFLENKIISPKVAPQAMPATKRITISRVVPNGRTRQSQSTQRRVHGDTHPVIRTQQIQHKPPRMNHITTHHHHNDINILQNNNYYPPQSHSRSLMPNPISMGYVDHDSFEYVNNNDNIYNIDEFDERFHGLTNPLISNDTTFDPIGTNDVNAMNALAMSMINNAMNGGNMNFMDMPPMAPPTHPGPPPPNPNPNPSHHEVNRNMTIQHDQNNQKPKMGPIPNPNDISNPNAPIIFIPSALDRIRNRNRSGSKGNCADSRNTSGRNTPTNHSNARNCNNVIKANKMGINLNDFHIPSKQATFIEGIMDRQHPENKPLSHNINKLANNDYVDVTD